MADLRIPIKPSRAHLAAQRRRTGWSLVRWGLGFGLIFGLLFGFATTSVIGSNQAVTQYNSSSTCPEAAPAPPGCRLETAAVVTGVKTASGRYPRVYLKVVPEGGDYDVGIYDSAPQVGANVEVELWDGKITLFNGRQTFDNPALDPNIHAWWVSALFAVAVLGWLGTTAAGVYKLRTPLQA